MSSREDVLARAARLAGVPEPTLVVGAKPDVEEVVGVLSRGQWGRQLRRIQAGVPDDLFQGIGGGMIWLEDVDRLTDDQQRRLLRKIETEGGVRLVTSTSESLPHLIQAGRFSRALFYRIGVILLTVPPKEVSP